MVEWSQGEGEKNLARLHLLSKKDHAGLGRVEEVKVGIQVPPSFPVESTKVLPGSCGQRQCGLGVG